MCPWSSVEAGSKHPEIKGETKQHSSHLRKIGACLRHQILNLRNENLLLTPERRCTWSAERTWILLNWILWRSRVVLRQAQQPMEKCRRMKRPQCMSKNWICSWQWKSSKTRQQSYRSESFAITLTSGSTVKNPHLIQNGIRIQCNTENFVPIVVLGLSTSSCSSFPSSTSMTPSIQEIDHPTSSSSSSTSPTTTVSSDSETRAREDLSGIDFLGKKRWDPFSKPTKNPKPNKNEDHEKERRDPFCSEIPEWLQEFRENLVDDRVPECRDSHASSSREPSLEPMPTRSADFGKHSVYTHFPKDRNCEICHRTKITTAPCRRRIGGAVPRAEYFCDLITVDH